MSRNLAVKVEGLERAYSRLLSVERDLHGACRLTTLSPDQDTAEIEVYLLHYRRGEEFPRSTRRVHRFRISHTRGSDGRRPVFVLEAKRLRRRVYELRLSRDGRSIDAATIHIPRSRRGLFVIPLLLLLVAGSVALVGRCTGGERSAVASSGSEEETGRSIRRDTTRPEAETPRTDSTPPRSTSPQSTTADEGAPVPENSPLSQELPDRTGQSAAPDDTPSSASIDQNRSIADTAPPDEVIVPATENQTVYFRPDSVSLTPEGRRVLNSLRERLTGREVETIIVEGHTALYGNEAGREMISTGRVRSVVEYLNLPAGMSIDRKAYGASRPVTRATEEQQLNRRAEIIVTYRRDE
ncbi:MAG: OmpA family protein [Alkalispirochaeta sp.]